MTERDFVYWLQGIMENRELDPETAGKPFTEKQMQSIRDHLKQVFTKRTAELSPRHTPFDSFPAGPHFGPFDVIC